MYRNRFSYFSQYKLSGTMIESVGFYKTENYEKSIFNTRISLDNVIM